MKEVTIDDAIEFLNQLLELDPHAIDDLVNHRVLCNTRITDSKVITTPTGYLGILGILNGLFGEENCYIAAKANPDGSIVKFVRTDK